MQPALLNVARLFTLTTACCLPIAFLPVIDDSVRALFGFLGYLGAIVYVTTGANLDVRRTGRVSRLTLVLVFMSLAVVAAFFFNGIFVWFSPSVGDPDFNPNAFVLRTFRTIWNALNVLGAAIVLTIAASACRGWAHQQTESMPAERRRRATWGWAILSALTVCYLGIGALVLAPQFTVPPILRAITVGLLLGIVFASTQRPAATQVDAEEAGDAERVQASSTSLNP